MAGDDLPRRFPVCSRRALWRIRRLLVVGTACAGMSGAGHFRCAGVDALCWGRAAAAWAIPAVTVHGRDNCVKSVGRGRDLHITRFLFFFFFPFCLWVSACWSSSFFFLRLYVVCGWLEYRSCLFAISWWLCLSCVGRCVVHVWCGWVGRRAHGQTAPVSCGMRRRDCL